MKSFKFLMKLYWWNSIFHLSLKDELSFGSMSIYLKTYWIELTSLYYATLFKGK